MPSLLAFRRVRLAQAATYKACELQKYPGWYALLYASGDRANTVAVVRPLQKAQIESLFGASVTWSTDCTVEANDVLRVPCNVSQTKTAEVAVLTGNRFDEVDGQVDPHPLCAQILAPTSTTPTTTTPPPASSGGATQGTTPTQTQPTAEPPPTGVPPPQGTAPIPTQPIPTTPPIATPLPVAPAPSPTMQIPVAKPAAPAPAETLKMSVPSAPAPSGIDTGSAIGIGVVALGLAALIFAGR